MNGKKPARPHPGGVEAAPTDTSAYAAPGEVRGGDNGRQPMGSRGKCPGSVAPQVTGLGTCSASFWL